MRLEKDNIKNSNDFLGGNINIAELKSNDISDLSKLKKIVGKRTKEYKNIFKELSSTFENVDDETSLYNLYSLMADKVYNVYYLEALRTAGG